MPNIESQSDRSVEANTIFQQPWWLEAVAPGQWNIVDVRNNDEVTAKMPYVLKHGPLGLRLMITPPLTQTLGPWLAPYPGKYAKRLSYEKSQLQELIRQLPPFDLFAQKFHYSITNWLPFYWSGFQQTTFYTYVLEDLTDLDTIWAEFRGSVRREIRKAQKEVSVRSDLGLETFWRINSLTFERQGRARPYNYEYVQRIDQACKRHDARRIFFAEDAKGRIHAVLYLVWDDNGAYYLMGGADPELRTSGASSLLMWEAIQFAATVTKSFDFEGSMVEPIERFFRGFGARQKRYFYITKSNSWLTNEAFVELGMKLPFLRRLIG